VSEPAADPRPIEEAEKQSSKLPYQRPGFCWEEDLASHESLAFACIKADATPVCQVDSSS
jgi:hypothetical protein